VPFQIFLIEDNPADARLISLALRFQRIASEITYFDDGLKVLNTFFAEGDASQIPMPDLIVLDLNMPSVGGLKLLRTIRESSRFKQVPVAICTSSKSLRDREEAMSLGADGYISKPIQLEPFLEKVGGAVRDILASRFPPEIHRNLHDVLP